MINRDNTLKNSKFRSNNGVLEIVFNNKVGQG